MNRTYLQALNLLGLTVKRPVQDPLAVLRLENQLYIPLYYALDKIKIGLEKYQYSISLMNLVVVVTYQISVIGH